MKRKKVLWFKAKDYGWGWYPITWQGWLVTFLFIGGIVSAALHSSNRKTALLFSVQLIILLVLLFAICLKTGEKPRWRWGRKK